MIDRILPMRPTGLDTFPRYLAPLDCGGAVVVVLLDASTAHVHTPSLSEGREVEDYGATLAECWEHSANGVNYTRILGHFRRDGAGDWAEAVDLSTFSVSRYNLGGEATRAGLSKVRESVARMLRDLAEAYPAAFETARVADLRSDRARALDTASKAVRDLSDALSVVDRLDRDLGAQGAPRAAVRLDGEGRPVLDLDGCKVGLRLGRHGGLRLGVDFRAGRRSLDGLDVSTGGGEPYAVDSTDDPKSLLFGEPELGRTVARSLLAHCSALLAEREGLRLAEGRAPGEVLAVDQAHWDAWGAVVDACGALGLEPDPSVEASADRLGEVVRAARAFVVAADDLREAWGDGEAWAEVVAQANRLRREVEARGGSTGAGVRGPRSRALLRAGAEACATILDRPDYPEGGLAPVVESVAEAVAPFDSIES